MAPVGSFEQFQSVGNNIYLFEPPNPASTALVTLCTWLGGATPQRIQKYIDGYRVLYPNSRILLITTYILEITVLPFSVLHARLAPARDVIRQVIFAAAEREESGSILLHIFSHGGCNTAIQLALSLRNDPGHSPLELGAHLRGIIFDCCPGDPSFSRAYQAAALSLPCSPPLARTIGKTLLFPAVGLITVLQQIGWTSSVQQLRAQLNNPTVFGTTARRLYLYSTADQMVGPEWGHSDIVQAFIPWSKSLGLRGSINARGAVGYGFQEDVASTNVDISLHPMESSRVPNKTASGRVSMGSTNTVPAYRV
ncbi:uncharacterized protein GIQ15_05652 [Arthroderma uncinatum]|uniref:uncharacterized protein n=1 Tax=Arthroderma uncinatum TaxID=74035 RepID=UPI00144AED01|nr:uncharacterized protein GIQ15_05652 [Arthroderma uncinatum]KAF3480305.1 hypothetical protein GIQ15_05652 [Arthroderma uncinatum]